MLGARARAVEAADTDTAAGCGYGAYASGGWSLEAAVGSSVQSASDYPRYIVGHGPMFPGENYTGPRYSYMTPTPTPAASTAPIRP